jgi:protein required for attachment to host cells
MLLPKGTVIAVADGEKFELYRNGGTATEPRLETVAVPDLAATNYSAGARDHDKVSRFTPGAPRNVYRYSASAPNDSEKRLEEGAHAAAVIQWLNNQILQHQFDKLIIIADSRSLGEMRRRYHKELRNVLIRDLDRIMTGHSPEAIVKALRAID